MKILMLGVQLTSLVNFRGPLIRDLVAAGHEVVAVAPEPAEPWLGQLKALGARYIEAPMARTGINPLRDAKTLFWLWRMLRREKPEVIFAFQAKAVIYGIPAAWLAGVKRRVAMIEGLGQGFVTHGRGFKRRILRLVLPTLYKLGLAKAQRVLFLNPDDVQDFIALGIIKNQKTMVLPGIGVDLRHFSAQPPPQGPLTFLMVARLLVDKGVREYAEAARIVRDTHPDVRFQLLGPLDSSPSGIKLEEVKGWHAVDYRGETHDVRPFLVGCHVFVLPTFYREGLPRSIMEAMATGRAVITTNVPGARQTVVDKVNGLLVEARSPKALAEAMLYMIEHPEQLAPMGKASRQLAEERYEVGSINRLIIGSLTE